MKSIFSSAGKIYQAVCPGRLDVMGGVADYSGSLLLQIPIREQVKVRLQKRTDGLFQLQTIIGREPVIFSIHIHAIQAKTLRETRQFLHTLPHGSWATYILGCFLLLEQEKKLKLKGASIRIDSSIPWGKGVSSSAALEVAVMKAIAGAYHIKLGAYELPLLCQRVENEIVGAACGLMDQLSVSYGRKDHLLPITCQPYRVDKPVAIPGDIHFFGIDSGVRHAVGGSSYGEVRTSAFMGYTMIALLEGASSNALQMARKRMHFEHLPWKGYLANIPPSVFREKYEAHLPETITGAAFMKNYGVSIDIITEIDPLVNYRVRSCARHPVEENFRIRLFRQLLKEKPGKKSADLPGLLGEFMFQSHESYSAIGLGNERTDEIVQLVREAGNTSGVSGARITGGGSGGTVCILAQGDKGRRTVKQIHASLQHKYGKDLYLFKGSSNGTLTLK